MNTITTERLTEETLADNPFVGLRPFNSDEGLLFFGRQEQTVDLMQKLHHRRFLGIVGSSGCGKSSLIRAGLIPKLLAGFLVGDRERWRIAEMRPGDAPLRNLAVALFKSVAATAGDAAPTGPALDEAAIAEQVKLLRRAGARAVLDFLAPALAAADANLLLLADQFEELFTLNLESDDEHRRDEAADFVSIILELAEQRALPIYVVLTMRSDYLGECDNFYGLPEALNRSQYLVPRLTRQQRQQAIEGPIRLYGQKITPRLVDRVLNDMGGQSDQLPVMQHALMRTWDNWQASGDPMLDSWHYDEAGKLDGALSKDANAAMEGMSPEDERVTRLMFQALTKVDARNRLVRRPTKLSELQKITGASEDKLRKIIKRFYDKRRWFLYIEDDKPTADPLVNISHESLIRQWTKMQEWLKDEAISRDIYTRLADEAARYETDRAEGRLWRDPELEQALFWYHEQRQPNVAWAQRYHTGFAGAVAFLEQSRLAREAQAAKDAADEAERERQRERELQSARELAVRNRALLAALLITLVLGAISWVKTAEARSKTRALEAGEKRLKDYDAQVATVEAALGKTRSNLTAKEADLRGKSKELTDAAAALEENSRKLEDNQRKQAEAEIALRESKAELERSLAVLKKANEDAKQAQIKVDQLNRINDEQQSQVLAANAGNLTNAGSENLNTGALLAAHALLRTSRQDQPRQTFEPDDYLLTQIGHQAARRLLTLLTPRDRAGERKTDDIFGSVTFSPDGKRLVALGRDRTLRVLDGRNHELLGQTRQLASADSQFALSHQGEHLAVEEADRTLRIWRISPGQPLRQVGAELKLDAKASALALSHDGARAVVATENGKVWMTGAQQLAVELNLPRPTPTPLLAEKNSPKPEEQKEPINAAAFSPDGRYLALGGGEVRKLRSEGQQLDNAIYLADTTTNPFTWIKLEMNANCSCLVKTLAFASEGKYLLSGVYTFDARDGRTDSRFYIWNVTTRKQVANFTGVAGFSSFVRGAGAAVFSKDKNYLAIPNGEKALRVVRLNWGRRTLKRDNTEELLETAVAVEDVRMIHEQRVAALFFSEDAQRLTAVGDRGLTQVWRTSNQPETTRLILPDDRFAPDIAFNAAGHLLASADGYKVKKFDPATKQQTELILAAVPDDRVKSRGFSQDGNYLFTFTEKGLIRVAHLSESWAGQQTKFKEWPADFGSKFEQVALSPRGNWLALRDKDGALSLFPAAAGGDQPVTTPQLHIKEKVEVLAFNAQDTRLLAILKQEVNLGNDQTRREWQAKIWKLDLPSNADVDRAPDQILELPISRAGQIIAAAFTPNADHLVTISEGDNHHAMRMWQVATGQEVFKDAPDEVRPAGANRVSLTFDKTGRYLALTTADGADIWELDWDRQAASKIADLSGRTYRIAFNPDGSQLVSVEGEQVSLRPWQPHSLAKDLCARLGRNLTYDEWQHYLRRLPYAKACPMFPVHESYVEQAIKLAREGSKRSVEQAIDYFKRLKELDNIQQLDPLAEAQWHKEAQEADDKLLRIDEELRGLTEVKDEQAALARVTNAVRLFKDAQKFYGARRAHVFGQPDPRNQQVHFPRSIATTLNNVSTTLNNVCWWGSLYGQAGAVLTACDQSVKMDPLHAGNRDSLGVAKALEAKSPAAAQQAIEEFRPFIQWSNNEAHRQRRACWIAAWDRHRKNPFVGETRAQLLQELRKESANEKGPYICPYTKGAVEP